MNRAHWAPSRDLLPGPRTCSGYAVPRGRKARTVNLPPGELRGIAASNGRPALHPAPARVLRPHGHDPLRLDQEQDLGFHLQRRP
jgi:hypothetical protein